MKVDRKGFTLLEVMVVVVILGILAALAIPRFIRTAEKARGDGAIADLKLSYTGQKMFYNEHKRYATTFDELSPYIEDPNRPNSPFKYAIGPFVVPPDQPDQQVPVGGWPIRATRKWGIYAGRFIQIDRNENLSGDWPFLPR